jgi:NitT/TauT family transport system substrate-binding protein
MAYVGLDPRKDINYAWVSKAEAMRLFTQGEIDAFMSFAPDPEELREKKIGRVLVDTNVDKPWSQYFCCTVVGNREFIRRHPVATKRALRALLKGNDICARDPELAARTLVEKKVRKASEYKYIVQAMKNIRYDKWREYKPEDTIRFYALRLREVGMIKSSPQEIISQNTDWRFLRELKKDFGIKW